MYVDDSLNYIYTRIYTEYRGFTELCVYYIKRCADVSGLPSPGNNAKKKITTGVLQTFATVLFQNRAEVRGFY